MEGEIDYDPVDCRIVKKWGQSQCLRKELSS